MANSDHQPALLQVSNNEVDVQLEAPHTQSSSGTLSQGELTPFPSESSPAPAKDSSETASTSHSRTNPPSTRPTLVQLGSGNSQSQTHHPPKKFNAVNINKKFLEQTSAAAAMATTSPSAANKSTSTISRPQSQTAHSHSRLVTTKLTGSPAPSTTAGPGWSRPTSTAPSSTGTNSPIGSSPLPSAAVALSAASAAPQLPHVGRVIQPQPRAAVLQTTNLPKESSKLLGKAAWGNVKPPSVAPIMTTEDFPTAAEVAQASTTRKSKQDDQKSTPEPTSAVKHKLEEEADTFRGVHLDPNAHHWDEMEEDNDDFLGGVIEFGDGRQYKVEATEPSGSPPPDHARLVSKEERFVDDFDRSWPKSKPSPTSSSREFSAPSPVLSNRATSLQSGQDHPHPHLFNERLNRLEPYSNHGPRSSQQSTFQNRRGSHNDGSTTPAEFRKGIQLLQKSAPGNGELPPRPSRGERMNGAPSRSGFPSRDGGPRRDHPPTSPRATRSDWGHHHEMAPSTSLQGREREERGRHSDMGPPPVPLHATRRTSQDSASGRRQLPPHLSPNLPLPRPLPSQESSSRFGPAVPTSPTSQQRIGQQYQAPPSPALSHTSIKSAFSSVLSPGSAAIALPGGVTADLNEVTKDLMQSAAQRAKQRKIEEEKEREAQKERARRKAAELEEKMKEKGEKEGRENEEREEEEKQVKEREKEAVAFIESAVDGAKPSLPSQGRRTSVDATSLPKNLPRRPPSLRGQQRQVSTEAGPATGAGVGTRRASFGIGTRAVPAVEGASPASQVDSWRTKANPLPPPPSKRPPHSAWTPSPTTAPAAPTTTLVGAPSALDHVADIVEGSMTDLEVVDFSNMGEFVGGGEGVKEVVEPEKNELLEVDSSDSSAKQEEAGLGGPSHNKPRPTASDFFEDKLITAGAPAKVAENVWRRRTSASVAVQADEERKEKEKVVVVKEETTLRVSSSAPVVSPTVSLPHAAHQQPRLRPHAEASMSALDDVMSRIKGAIDGMQADGVASKENRPPVGSPEPEQQQQQQQHHHQHYHHPASRAPYPPQPSTTAAKSTPRRERWQPAPTPLHLQQQQRAAEEKLEALREPLSTSTDPSYTPPSSSSSSPLPVHLPTTSRKVKPIPFKQISAFSRTPLPARFDLLSFDPPVRGMKGHDFTVNSVLFRLPYGNGFKANRIRISLPPGTKTGHHLGPRTVSLGPKYNIGGTGPGIGGNGGGGFGKGGNADGAISWRKSGSSATPATATNKVDEENERGTTASLSEKQKSDLEENMSDMNAKQENSTEKHQPLPQAQAQGESTTAAASSSVATRRQQPKMMPAGSAVAFIRDSRIDVVEADPKPLVNFIVTSELDDEPVIEVFSAVSTSSGSPEAEKGSKKRGDGTGAVPLSSNTSLSSSDGVVKAGMEFSSIQSSASSVGKLKAPETKPAEESTTMRSISATPSSSHQSTTSSSTPWGRTSLSVPIKDSGAARAPDPEHLKAVWSQPNKADLNPVNSLEGIADDLTSVPFSIQEVKSEDGETPPPTLPATTSRMSLHEVTKAFQKVPSSSPSNSSTTQSRNAISPPSSSNNHTPATRSPYPYSPMPPNAMRLPHSAYEQHYSPMLSHSPSPAVVYPHQLTSSPVPSRMPVNGHAHAPPMYQMPGWLPQNSTPGNPGAVMRPMMSPYPAHMMPYGTPSYGHPMGAMPAPQPQPPVGTSPGAAGRGRGVPMHMSPAMTHAHAHAHPGAPMYASSPVMMHMQPVPHQNHAVYMGVPPQPGATPAPGTPGRGQPRTDGSQPSNHPSQIATASQRHHHQPPTYNPPSFIRSTW
ncbi:hypothetical protein D9756_004224 [Leucocoprinus leucothites]|uniref:Uncharacterized protein n=1 Tax=Leucocoprinus leucothites TaxID=201217 RepID=A0A8H5DA04_9AGAR|nr:hypothetical protein D9756_004224 [Leucoagaricus leucothites]